MTLDKKPRACARATVFIMSPATMMEPEPASKPPADDVEAIAHQEPIVASGDQLHAPISGSRESDKTDATTAGGTALPSSTPPSPGATDGAESPRKRFAFMSLFHSHGGSSSRSRIRGGSVSGLPSTAATSPTTPERSLSPSPPSPRPFHRSSQSASGSMLDLLSRSWSENPVVRSRSERGAA